MFDLNEDIATNHSDWVNAIRSFNAVHRSCFIFLFLSPPWVLGRAFLTTYHPSLPPTSFHFLSPLLSKEKTVFYELKPVEWVIDCHLSRLWAHWCLDWAEFVFNDSVIGLAVWSVKAGRDRLILVSEPSIHEIIWKKHTHMKACSPRRVLPLGCHFGMWLKIVCVFAEVAGVLSYTMTLHSNQSARPSS